MAVSEQVCGVGRDLPGYSKGDTPGCIAFTPSGRLLSPGFGLGDGKTGCQVFQIHGRHPNPGLLTVEAQEGHQGAQPDVQ